MIFSKVGRSTLIRSATLIALCAGLFFFCGVAPCLGQACSNGWTLGHQTPQGIFRSSAVHSEGKIYLVGGGLAEGGFLNRVWIYDVDSDTWSLGAPYDLQGWMNTCAVAYQGKVYMFGGWKSSTVFLQATRIYNIAGNTWTMGADVPFLASGSYCAQIDGKVYLAGGSDAPYSMHKHHAAYDIATNSWDSGTADLPTARAYGLGATDGERFYVFGSDSDDRSYAYDPQLQIWAELDRMGDARMSPAGGYAGSTLWAVSGGDVVHGVPDWWDPLTGSERYRIGANHWETLSAPLVPVTASASAVVPGRHGGALYVFGGTQIDHERNETQILNLCVAQLESVSPSLAVNGAPTELTIDGWGFERYDTAYLEDDDWIESLSDLQVPDARTITGSVGAFARVGLYDLVVQSSSGESARIEDALTVCGCLIGEQCIDVGQTHPTNLCLLCDPTRARFDWSFNDGVACDDELFCNGSDLCLSGSCADHAGDPCAADQRCDEGLDKCLPTGDDTDEDDDDDGDPEDDDIADPGMSKDDDESCGC
ncbi:MAG: kelch repeat-containing protein [Candidatus Alcyoniella australis]|nr:kelch repeat-containing protein [Candidatus Alcyoniella australis]